MNSGEKQEFRMIKDQSRWSFVNGRWRDGENGQIMPPDVFLKGIVDQGRDYEKRVLDLKWRFKADPDKRGTDNSWHLPDFDDGDWDLLNVDKHWNDQGYDGYHGSAWYRLRFMMPEEMDTRRYFWLVFSGADKEAIVYLNGKRVCEHTTEATGKDGMSLYSEPFKVDVRHLQPGREHTIAVRVDSEKLGGGLWRPVSLVSAEAEGGAEFGERDLAVRISEAYSDFEAEFEFRWDGGNTDAGLIFRARDAQHYYLVHFPVSGQTGRAEAFWGAISKVDGSGFVQLLKMDLVPGVTSERGFWHKVRVLVEGETIRAWVDGRPMSTVTDATYSQPGHVGLYASNGSGRYETSTFRNFTVCGRSEPGSFWDASVQPMTTRFEVMPGATGCGQIARTAEGDLIVPINTNKMLQSRDNGKTWCVIGTLHASVCNAPFPLIRVEDKLVMYAVKPHPPFHILKAESADNGKTWTDPVQTGEIVFPPEEPFVAFVTERLLELSDGTLLLFGFAETKAITTIRDGVYHVMKEPPENVGYCLRSTDSGQTWSDPIDLDGRPADRVHWMLQKDLPSEIAAAQTKSGTVVTLARPLHAPNMWESRSSDQGRTWTPRTRAAFTMYGSPSMVCTASGALVIGGRFPGIAVQVSHDEGMTWKCYMIDVAVWANGCLFEVEPDVVLFLYGGLVEPEQLRGQIFRVTPGGLEPA